MSFMLCHVKEKTQCLGIDGEEVEAEGKYRWVQNCQQRVKFEKLLRSA